MILILRLPEPLRFAIVGIAATLTHLIVARVLLSLWINNQSLLAINTTAFLCAFVVSFIGHRYVTFQREGSVVRYMGVAVLGYMLNNIVALTVSYMGGGIFFAIVCGTVTVPVLVYLLSKIWAFQIERGGEI